MNLVWFLTIFAALIGVLGEFGQFPFGSTTSVSLLDIASVMTLIALAIWQVGIKKELVYPKTIWWIIGFEIVGMIGVVLSGYFGGSVYLFRFVVYSLWIWVGYSLIQSKTIQTIWWEKLILASGVAILLTGIGQMIWLPNLKVLEGFGYDPHQNRMTGLFLDPNFFGAVMAICTVVAWEYFWQQKSRWAAVVGTFFGLGVVFSLSRSAYVMLGMMIGLWGWQKSKKWTLWAIVGVVLVLLLVPRINERMVGIIHPDESAKERFSSWQKGITIWQMSPVVGVGFDNIRIVSQNNNLIKVFSADGGNSGAGVDASLLVVLATTGVLGLVFFVTFWFSVCRQAWRRRQKVFVILVVGVIIDSLFINSWFWPLMMMWLYLWSGMVLAKD